MTGRGLADAMREHFASYGVTDVEIRLVAHTEDHLDATTNELQQRLRNGRDPFVAGPMNDRWAQVR